MKRKTWTREQHEIAARELRRIRLGALVLACGLPTRREQDRAAKIEEWADKVRHDLSTRAHKEGLDVLAVYYPRKVECEVDPLELLARAAELLTDALEGMKRTGRNYDARAPEALALWLDRLMDAARRSADVGGD